MNIPSSKGISLEDLTNVITNGVGFGMTDLISTGALFFVNAVGGFSALKIFHQSMDGLNQFLSDTKNQFKTSLVQPDFNRKETRRNLKNIGWFYFWQFLQNCAFCYLVNRILLETIRLRGNCKIFKSIHPNLRPMPNR